jgi:hypothetical protein
MFLVDQDGIIVAAEPFGRFNEPDIAEMIDVLMDRQRAGS